MLPENFEEQMRKRMRWGMIGVFAWILLLCGGALIPSAKYRENLGFSDAAASVDPKNKPPTIPLTKPVISGGEKCWSFVVASLTYSPLNIAFLCVLSAFIGGCSINKNAIYRIQKDIKSLQSSEGDSIATEIARLSHKFDYLTENPCYSAIRGFVVFLVIISGLFVIGAPLTGEKGDDVVSLQQYLKLAGLFSFFSYLSGYDPTVFTSFISFGSSHLNKGKNP